MIKPRNLLAGSPVTVHFQSNGIRTMKTFAERLAKIDGRPFHPEDYQEYVDLALKKITEVKLDQRLTLLEKNDLWSSITDVYSYLIDGKLRDAYTGKIIFEDKSR